jgi:hypothetical protein
MSYNMMIGYDIYDCFTMEHFRLRQRMTLTTKMYCSRLYYIFRPIARGISSTNSGKTSFKNIKHLDGEVKHSYLRGDFQQSQPPP